MGPLLRACAVSLACLLGVFAETEQLMMVSRMDVLINRFLSVMEEPWPIVSHLAGLFESGAVGNFSEDLLERDFLRSSMFAHITAASKDASGAVYMVYVAFDADGSFMGYYGEGQNSRGPDYYYTLLDGAACDASSEAAVCRRYFDVDQTTGAPPCDDDAPVGGAACYSGQEKGAKIPTSKAPISVVFHSFRLILGRVIISRSDLEA